MTHWRRLLGGIRDLLRTREVEADTTDEVASYFEEAVADQVARGIPEREARRRVRLEYGDGLTAREVVRSHGWEHAVRERIADLRVAVRRLWRDRAFTTVAVLTLGLGVGAATAILSVVRPVLFDPLPYPDAGRLVSVSDRSDDGALLPTTFGTFLEVEARSAAFVSVSVSRPWQPTLTGTGEPERIEGRRVGAAYLDVLSVWPVLGAGFDPRSDLPGGPDVVILSDGLWRGRFESDPTIVGRAIELDGRPFTVMGVMGPSFSDMAAPTAQVWAPLQYDPRPVDFDTREWGHHLDMTARLARDVSLDEARRRMAAIAAQPVAEFARPSHASLANGWSIRRLREAASAGGRPTAWVLLGAAFLLLAIACANLGLLMLARESRRQGELSLRLALGAGRLRIAGYVLTEGLVLLVVSGAIGALVATAGVGGLVAASPPELPRIAAARVDLHALGPAVALAATVLVGFGLGTAFWRSARDGAPVPGGTARARSLESSVARRLLVVAEVAVAVVLLIGAGLLVRSTEAVLSVPPGFEPDGSIVFRIYGTGLESGDRATHQFFQDALAAVERVPGVSEAGLTSQMPLSGEMDMYGVTLDEPERAPGTDGSAFRYAVSPSYLSTMGIEVRHGRALENGDRGGAVPSVMLSESLARRLFADRDPLGRRLHFGAVSDQPFTVVGVVADVKQASLASGQHDAVYVPTLQWHWSDRVRWLVVRSERSPATLVPAVRQAIWGVDPNQPIVQIQSTADLVARSEAQRRFVLMVLLAFSLSAATLVAIGLYGVVSSSVTERAREIGVRGALGATSTDIVSLVLRRGMVMTAIGTSLGLAVSVFASRTLSSLLFGVSRLDAMTYVGVVGMLALLSAVACWLPTSRAARVDPSVTLRAE